MARCARVLLETCRSSHSSKEWVPSARPCISRFSRAVPSARLMRSLRRPALLRLDWPCDGSCPLRWTAGQSSGCAFRSPVLRRPCETSGGPTGTLLGLFGRVVGIGRVQRSCVAWKRTRASVRDASAVVSLYGPGATDRLVLASVDLNSLLECVGMFCEDCVGLCLPDSS